tara:strand:+ start:1968 stop:2459 length:492 start_codon:yes stop_codon:yes gene_type:complete
MKERAIWIVVVLMILSGAYYWVVVDSNRLENMSNLEESDVSLKGDVNEWSEYYDRLEKKWIGTSKHVKTLQDETKNHYEAYESKVDSINNTFENLDFKVDQLNEVLSSRIDLLKDDLESLNEEFSNYKRTSQRDLMKLKKNIEGIQSDIEKINNKLTEEFGEE